MRGCIRICQPLLCNFSCCSSSMVKYQHTCMVRSTHTDRQSLTIIFHLPRANCTEMPLCLLMRTLQMLPHFHRCMQDVAYPYMQQQLLQAGRQPVSSSSAMTARLLEAVSMTVHVTKATGMLSTRCEQYCSNSCQLASSGDTAYTT